MYTQINNFNVKFMETLISYLNNIWIDNTFITTVQNSKDIFLGFIAAIFAIFIPLVIHYYSTLENSNFPYLDSKIFTADYFNLFKIIRFLIWMLVGIFLLSLNNILYFLGGVFLYVIFMSYTLYLIFNLYNFLKKKYDIEKIYIERQNFLEKNKNFNNEIILEFLQNNTWKEPVFYLEFFYNKLLKYEINFLNAHSKLIIESLLNKIENEDNFHTKKIGEFLKKIELTDLFWDTLNKEHIFEDYKFTTEFFKIFFEKIHWKIKNQKTEDRGTEQLIRNLLFLYKKLEENSHILNSFKDQDFKLLLKIYKSDSENKNSYLSRDLMSIIILMIEKNSWDTYLIEKCLQDVLNNENDAFRFKFLLHFHLSVFNSKIILEDTEFMKEYGKEVFQKYKILKWSIWKKRTNIKIELYQKLVHIIQFNKWGYNHWYDNILIYWLLEYEPILFVELLVLYFAHFWENIAISILEQKIVFWWKWRTKVYLWDWEKDIEVKNKQEKEDTIKLFVTEFWWDKKVLENLKIQFQEIIDENKREERDIRRSKYYIWLIDELIICWKKQEMTKKHEK